MGKMNKYTIPVIVVCENLDTEVVQTSLAECLRDGLPEGTMCIVQEASVKPLSEQGAKVLRARVFGVTAEQAGDAANPKPVKAPVLAGDAPATA